MARGILDTSTLILLGRLPDHEALPDEPLITAITLAELSVGPLVVSDEEERAAREQEQSESEQERSERQGEKQTAKNKSPSKSRSRPAPRATTPAARSSRATARS